MTVRKGNQPLSANKRVGSSQRTIQTKNQELGFDSARGMFEFLGNSLLQQAVEPNMHAYKPHAKQLLFHESMATGKLFLGGNRSGKTSAGVIEDLWWITRRHPYRLIPDTQIRGRVLGDGFENGTINEVLIPTIKRWILPSDLINGSWEDSWSRQDRALTLTNGSFIEFKSYDQDIQKHAGTSRHFIHFDEEPPQNIYIENLIRTVDTAGSWWMTMTPLNGMNWVYDELYLPAKEHKLKDIVVFEVSMLDNPHLSESVVDQIMQNIDAAEKEQRLYGKFSEKGGLIFPEFGEPHLLSDSPFNYGGIYNSPPADWRIYTSFDFGINNPTAILWHAVSSSNHIVTFAEHFMADMIIRDHARVVHEVERKLAMGTRIYLRAGDPAGKQRSQITGTSIIQEYSDEGIFISTDYIPRGVSVGINKMRTYLKLGPSTTDPITGALAGPGRPHWQIVESECPNLVREMKRLHWKTYANSKTQDASNRQEEVHKKDDHAFDSCRYFFTLLPDLAPEDVWHSAPVMPKPHSYLDTLLEMEKIKNEGWGNDIPGFGMDPRHANLIKTGWVGGTRGFSDAEYNFENLEDGTG